MLKPFSTIKEIKSLLDSKQVSPQEVRTFYQDRLKKYNPTLNTCVEIFDKPSEQPATTHAGVLNNIPCIIKDNICIKDQTTSASSNIIKNFQPGYNATVTSRILQEGGSILGRANMDEFAMGGTGEYSAQGETKNPWDLSRTPGGSSSGSAAAVAAGLIPWALGSETGGSVRQPASFCNLVGLYPSYGLVSRFGLMAFGSSLDQAGPITRTVYDSALALSALAGHDSNDSTSLPEPKKNYTRKLTGKMHEPITLGVVRDALEAPGVDEEVRANFANSLKELELLGFKIKYLDLETFKYGNSVYFILSRAEAASNLSRIDGSLYGQRIDGATLEEMYNQTRSQGFGTEIKLRIMLGNYVLSSEHRQIYEKANQVRAMICAELDNKFAEVDLLISPTASSLPFKLGEAFEHPLQVYMSDYFVLPNCVAGMPGISVPNGFSKQGLPIGIQFIGPRLSEELLLQAAFIYEQHTQFYKTVPQGFE